MNNLESETVAEPSKSQNKVSCTGTENVNQSTAPHQETVSATNRFDTQSHEHIFLTDEESYDEGSVTRTKRCRCGVSIQVEEL